MVCTPSIQLTRVFSHNHEAAPWRCCQVTQTAKASLSSWTTETEMFFPRLDRLAWRFEAMGQIDDDSCLELADGPASSERGKNAADEDARHGKQDAEGQGHSACKVRWAFP